MLSNPPAYAGMTAAEQADAEKYIVHLEAMRLAILKDYKTSATIPHEHAYNMASLGDEMLEGYEKVILDADATYEEQAQSARELGGRGVSAEAAGRALKLCKKNRVLLEIMKPFGRLTLSDVASKIQKEWGVLSPSSLMQGEPKGLTERGLGGNPPSTKTIKNYIRQASPFPQQRVGQTSLKIK